MSGFHLGSGSLRKSRGLHPDLYAILRLAITLTPVDFAVTCGPRTRAQQAKNVAKGVSKTMNSRHIRKDVAGFGSVCHALDFVPWINGTMVWDDLDALREIIKAFHQAAEILQIEGLESGGEMWGWDYFHIQLSRKTHR